MVKPKSSRFFIALVLLGVLLIFAIAAPWLSPYDPLSQNLKNTFAPPTWFGGSDLHWLGTDSLGRDLLSRIIFGARSALYVAIVGAMGAAAIGFVLGVIAGFYEGLIDSVLSRLVDIWMSFPSVLLCIVLAAVIGPGLNTVIVAIVVIDWTRFFRVVRAETIVQKSRDYVSSGIIIGLSRSQILIKEIIPNILPLLITLLSLEMGIAIVVEAILSFVGLSSSGVPTWGGIIQEGRLYVYQAWWVMALPVMCIVAAVLSINAFGDELRRSIDPIR